MCTRSAIGVVDAMARVAGPAIDVVGLCSTFVALNTCKGYCLEKQASLKAPKTTAAVETNVQAEQPRGRGRRRVM